MKGIIPRSFSHIVNIINSTQDKQYLVRCSYLEIYNEEVHDLLGKGKSINLKETLNKEWNSKNRRTREYSSKI